MSTEYEGYDVLDIQPSDDGGRSTGYTRSRFRLDSNAGARSDLDRSGIAVLKPSGFLWVMDGREEIQDYRIFIAARKGMLVPFWVPTWKHDLALAENLTSGSTSLSVEKTGYVDLQFSNWERRHLAILLGDGSKYYRKIVTAVDEDESESLEIDSALPVDVSMEDSMLSFLLFCRLGVDDPELDWISTNVAQASLDFVELPQEIADLEEGS